MTRLESAVLPEYLDIAVKVLGAAAAGSLIGLEREYHGRPAGFRTHGLVCVASALLMLVTSYQWEWLEGAPLETIRTDPTRMAQGIMTGIGFLGGGVIFKEGLNVRGLTTAASIWITAAIGILFGVALYFPAVLGTLLTLGILAAFRRLEVHFASRFYAQFLVRFREEHAPAENEVRALLQDHGFAVANMSYGLVEDGTLFEFRTVINTGKRSNANRLAEHLRKKEGVVGFHISPTED